MAAKQWTLRSQRGARVRVPGTAGSPKQRSRRALALVLAAASLSFACSKASSGHDATTTNPSDPVNPGASKPAVGTNAMHILEQVKSWAGPDATVMPVEDIQVPGMSFFWIGTSKPGGPERGKGVAVVDGADRWQEGKEAMRAVLDRKVSDPILLARLSLLLLEDGGTPITDLDDTQALPASAVQEARQAGVTPPQMRSSGQNQVLEYWSYLRRLSRPGLMRSQLDLGTLQVTRSSLAEIQGQGADAVAQAEAWLGSPDINTRRKGVEHLATNCANPRAAQALARVITGHAQADTRALAAQMSKGCRGAGESTASVVEALGKALGNDASAEVRQWAASSLGEVGDVSARAALEKAQASDADEGVRLMAQMALKKLR